jgi:hypothetical protein
LGRFAVVAIAVMTLEISMPPDQIATLITSLCGLVPVICGLIPAIGTVIVAIYTVRFQGTQELKRNEQTHEWQEKERVHQRAASVEDRNIARKWQLSDRQIEERRKFLAEHKLFVDEYIRTILDLASRASLKGSRLEEYTLEQLKASWFASLDQMAKAYHHIEAFGNSELLQEFKSLMQTVDDNLVPVLQEPAQNRDKAANLNGTIAGAASKVTQLIEDIMIEKMQPRDWE